jgi:hypothetical protein
MRYFDGKFILEDDALYITNVSVQPDIAWEIEEGAERAHDDDQIDDTDLVNLLDFSRRIKDNVADADLDPVERPDPCDCGGPYKQVTTFIVWCDTCKQHFEVK